MSKPRCACTLTHCPCHIGPAAHIVALTAEALGMGRCWTTHPSELAQALWLAIAPKCNFAQWLLLHCAVDGC